jgi:hypothetical protein
MPADISHPSEAVSNQAITPIRIVLHRDATCPLLSMNLTGTLLLMPITTDSLLTSDNGRAGPKIEDDDLFVLNLEP